MTHNNRILLVFSSILGVILVAAPTGAQAQPAPAAQVGTTRSGPTLDLEVDPIAYALSGYSLHAGFTRDRFRLDLGAFALEVPEALHGVKGIDVYASGFGAKLDYHPFASLDGLFVGAMLSRSREAVTHAASRESRRASHTTVGARIGYRIEIANGFYALPWISIDVSLSERSQSVAGVDYAPGRSLFFPTIHLGKQF